jgi:hypothetical protein
VVIEMDILESPQETVVNSAGGSNADSREEAPVAEIQRDIAPETEVQQATHPEITCLRKGVGTKHKASGLQKGKTSKRSYVEEGGDFLLNEISLVAQNFRRPEFTLRSKPLSPPNIADETRERSGISPEHPPTSGACTYEEGSADTFGAVSPEIQLGNSTSGPEEGSRNEEPGQRTTLDPGAHVLGGRPLEGTSIPSSSGAEPSNAPCKFDFLGVRLLGDPLEALAFMLPDGLFEDIGKTTPFKFA